METSGMEGHSPNRFDRLDEHGNNLIKLIGTYEVVIWRILMLYFTLSHLFRK
jgi:hypothetical protein